MDLPIVAPYAEIQALLQPLKHSQIHKLAELSGVAATTLWRIKRGGGAGTENPGIETVRKFLPFVECVTPIA